MHPLKTHYYLSRYVATVRFIDETEFVVEGGMSEKRALANAKKEATFCYVKDLVSQSGVRLTLVNGAWVRQTSLM